jgi:RHS repeat-associated protein
VTGYDPLCNLVKDDAEKITNIDWSVYGKILSITKASAAASPVQKINYGYDASGNRISKIVNKQGAAANEYTWYVRDASGNVMSVYNFTGNNLTNGTLNVTEQHLYGSSRLGILNTTIDADATTTGTNANLVGSTYLSNFNRGNKVFELSNHLQNVLVTISDKKIGVDANSDGTIDYYNADVVTANDCYPFGMQMPGRKFNSSKSVYGFNGMRKDNEIYGEGNAYDFGARVYDPRLGKWLAVDMAAKSAPGWTPYRFGFDNPINFKDPDGGWEEDGHFWTVYAMGVALGMNKTDARALAVKAEYYDHIVHADNSMSILKIPGKEWMAWGKDGGVGTWADPVWQKEMHGLTGGSQSVLLSSVVAKIIGGDLFQLHTVGDAWAHSYIDEKTGERVMYGQHGRNEPWYAGLARRVLGNITFEHAKAGPESGTTADNIADRPVEYQQYVQSLLGIFNSKFHDKIKDNSMIDIFDYVQKKGGSKKANIYLLSSFVDLQTGTKSFSTENKSYNEKLVGYLKQMGVKYTSSTSTTSTTTSSGSGNVPITTTTTHYNTTINQ